MDPVTLLILESFLAYLICLAAGLRNSDIVDKAQMRLDQELESIGRRVQDKKQSQSLCAMAAMTDPKTKAAEVANRLGITTTTLYAYVNGDGSVKELGQRLLNSSLKCTKLE